MSRHTCKACKPSNTKANTQADTAHQAATLCAACTLTDCKASVIITQSVNFHSWIDTTSSIKLKLVLVYYSYQLRDQNCDNHVTTQHVQDIHKSLWVVSKSWFWHFEITLILRANHEFDLKSRLTWNQPWLKKKQVLHISKSTLISKATHEFNLEIKVNF